ncbi:sugar phosphate nucleotidyltransferase [Streptomyces sp. BE308]|uniref:sugar phosphate nucleotidyltransferase n=1 Tax=Streptomyces sp. BE308 TaxID=3002529 RepID=UPI002E785AD4|nr:sugar phosphate nucleotidyltransferase [Streptomyces sp. BE308]
MKALVLSGGMGSRLRPLTDHMPEQLIPRARKPVLIHCPERIREAGIIDSGRRVRVSLHTGFWQDTGREDCFAGPYTAVGDRATLRRAGIERSIALDGAELIDAGDVQDSLIGPEVTITEETSGAPGSGPTAAGGARAVVGI